MALRLPEGPDAPDMTPEGMISLEVEVRDGEPMRNAIKRALENQRQGPVAKPITPAPERPPTTPVAAAVTTTARQRRNRAKADRGPQRPWKLLHPTSIVVDRMCRLVYLDSRPKRVELKVLVHEARRRHGEVYLAAFCFEQQRLRHLRLSQVKGCWDAVTGEPFDLTYLVPLVLPWTRPQDL